MSQSCAEVKVRITVNVSVVGELVEGGHVLDQQLREVTVGRHDELGHGVGATGHDRHEARLGPRGQPGGHVLGGARAARDAHQDRDPEAAAQTSTTPITRAARRSRSAANRRCAVDSLIPAARATSCHGARPSSWSAATSTAVRLRELLFGSSGIMLTDHPAKSSRECGNLAS